MAKNVNLRRGIVKNNSSSMFSSDYRDEDGLFIFETNAVAVTGGNGFSITNAWAANFGQSVAVQFNYEVSNGTDTVSYSQDGVAIDSIWDDFAVASVPSADWLVASNDFSVADNLTVKIRGQFNFLRICGGGSSYGASWIADNIPASMTYFRIKQWGSNAWCNGYGYIVNSDVFRSTATDAPVVDNHRYGGFGYFLNNLSADFFETVEAANGFVVEEPTKTTDEVLNNTYRMIFTSNPRFTHQPPAIVITGNRYERGQYYSDSSMGDLIDFRNSRPTELNIAFALNLADKTLANSNALANNFFEGVGEMDISNCDDFYFAFPYQLHPDLRGWSGKTPAPIKEYGLENSFNEVQQLPDNWNGWDLSNSKSISFAWAGVTASLSYSGAADDGLTNLNGVTITKGRGLTEYNKWNPSEMKLDTSNIEEAAGAFISRDSFNCKDVENWDTSSFKGINYMFKDCLSLNLDFSNWDFSGLSSVGTFSQQAAHADNMIGEAFYNVIGMSTENLKKLLVAMARPQNEGGTPDLTVANAVALYGRSSETISFGTLFQDQVDEGDRAAVSDEEATAAIASLAAKGWLVEGLEDVFEE